jgi:hypothetical protein
LRNASQRFQGEKCDGPVLPFEADTGFLELEVIAGFRVWQLAFMGSLCILALIIVLCCIFRCRIPRTKQEIEADCARKKVTKQFSSHLVKIPVDRMELEKVLPEVITLEEQRIAKGIKEEKMTFMQKLKKALCSSGDDDEDEDIERNQSSKESLEKVSVDDIDLDNGSDDIVKAISTIAGGDPDRLSSHQEQLAAALKKLNKIRLVQQQLQSKNQKSPETPEVVRRNPDLADLVRSHRSRQRSEKSSSRERHRRRHEDRSSSRESGKVGAGGGRAQVLAKQKTCPQIPTETSSTDATVSTLKRSASDEETMKIIRDKRGKRLSRQIGLRDGNIAHVSPDRHHHHDAVYEEIDAAGRRSPETHPGDDNDPTKGEARTKF